METKHTPGEWFRPHYQRTAVVSRLDNGKERLVAEVYARGEECEANAALIESAPKLLLLLQCCAEWIREHAVKPDEITELTDAEALIARATASTGGR